MDLIAHKLYQFMRNFSDSLDYTSSYLFTENDQKALAVQLSRDVEINQLINTFTFSEALLDLKLSTNHEKTMQVFLELVRERLR